MTKIKPHPCIAHWMSDEVAECGPEVDDGLYSRLWQLTNGHSKMKNVWHRLSEADQRRINEIAAAIFPEGDE